MPNPSRQRLCEYPVSHRWALGPLNAKALFKPFNLTFSVYRLKFLFKTRFCLFIGGSGRVFYKIKRGKKSRDTIILHKLGRILK